MSSVIGDRIRAYREARGLSQVELARELGITKSYLSHIEAGRRSLPERMAEILGEELDRGDAQMTTYFVAVHSLRTGLLASPMRGTTVRATSPENALRAAALLPSSQWKEG